MGDFFAFRRMLAPLLIHLIFWVGVLGSIAGGVMVFTGHVDPVDYVKKNFSFDLTGLGMDKDALKLPVGICLVIVVPLLIRLYCELLMLPFRINGTLTDISNALKAQNEGTPGARR